MANLYDYYHQMYDYITMCLKNDLCLSKEFIEQINFNYNVFLKDISTRPFQLKRLMRDSNMMLSCRQICKDYYRFKALIPIKGGLLRMSTDALKFIWTKCAEDVQKEDEEFLRLSTEWVREHEKEIIESIKLD